MKRLAIITIVGCAALLLSSCGNHESVYRMKVSKRTFDQYLSEYVYYNQHVDIRAEQPGYKVGDTLAIDTDNEVRVIAEIVTK